MAQRISRFQSWLLEKRSFVFSWFSSDQEEVPEPEESLAELPPPLAAKLVEATQNLPSSPAEIESVRSALVCALERWQAQPQSADNSLVIISSPIAAVSRILTESLEDWGAEQKIPVRLLQWVARPSEPKSFKLRLQKQLGRGMLPETERHEIVVIPNLSWCFLRCLEGLDGVDYLRDVLLQDKSRFWLIGSGQVGWEYLNSVGNIKAYSKEFPLPELEGEQLQKWLSPIISELGITFSQPHRSARDRSGRGSKQHPSRGNSGADPLRNPKLQATLDLGSHFEQAKEQFMSASEIEAQYFEKLASVSEGISTVAVQVFLRSIRYEPAGETDSGKGLKAQSPSIPSLPDLSPDDHYVLYSLFLHGDLALTSLALSLGDARAAVQHRVQVLRRAGVVEQQNNTLRINPIHYPKLKRELANNNFIINESDT